MEKFEKMTPVILKFANAKAVVAMKDGLMNIIPLTLIGSIFFAAGFHPAAWLE